MDIIWEWLLDSNEDKTPVSAVTPPSPNTSVYSPPPPSARSGHSADPNPSGVSAPSYTPESDRGVSPPSGYQPYEPGTSGEIPTHNVTPPPEPTPRGSDPHEWWSPRNNPTEIPEGAPKGYTYVPSENTYPDGTKQFFWKLVPAGNDNNVPTGTQRPDRRGGGGGGGGGGGSKQPTTPPETLGELAWWANSGSVPPLLRNWASYLRSTLEQNSGGPAIYDPFKIDTQAEQAATVLNNETAPSPGMRTTNETLQRLQKLLNVEFKPNDNATARWQKIINAIPKADFEAQQLLASLRYNPNAGSWYAVDVAQLVNPQYT